LRALCFRILLVRPKPVSNAFAHSTLSSRSNRPVFLADPPGRPPVHGRAVGSFFLKRLHGNSQRVLLRKGAVKRRQAGSAFPPPPLFGGRRRFQDHSRQSSSEIMPGVYRDRKSRWKEDVFSRPQGGLCRPLRSRSPRLLCRTGGP